MRLRGSHVVVVVLALVGAFMGYAVLSGGGATQAESSPAPVGVGTLPPVDRPDEVPVIGIETQELSVGTISPERVHESRLRVWNDGKAALKILDIKTTCGCTVGHIPEARATIAPGADAHIDVYVDPKRIPGFYSKKTLTIYSNDPVRPTLQVNVEALVDPEFEFVERMAFGEVPKGEARSETFVLRQTGPGRFDLESVEEFVAPNQTPQGGVEFSVRPLPEAEWRVPDKPEYAVTATLAPDLPPGPMTRQVAIRTNIQRMPIYRIPLDATIVSFYRVSPAYPERLVLRLEDGAELESGTAYVQSERPVEITDVVADPALLRVVVRPTDDPRRVALDITVAPEAPRGRLEEDISITVRSGDEVYRDRVGVRAYITRITPPAGQ